MKRGAPVKSTAKMYFFSSGPCKRSKIFIYPSLNSKPHDFKAAKIYKTCRLKVITQFIKWRKADISFAQLYQTIIFIFKMLKNNGIFVSVVRDPSGTASLHIFITLNPY